MQSQIEIASQPTDSLAEARSTLAGLRTTLAEIGQAHRILLLAAGTHPLARWTRQNHTKKDRYDKIIREAQMVEQRNMVCGMHVHVEVPRPEDRVDLMNRMLPYMPVLLALSASSPFWEGRSTGLAAYRLSVWGELPRTGLPDLFRDIQDYDRYVAAMVQSEVIPDASFLLCRSRVEADAALAEVRGWVEANGLTLHPDKTHVGDCRQPGCGFDFLVHRLRRKVHLSSEMNRCTASKLVDRLFQTDESSVWVGPLGYRFEDGHRVVRKKSLDRFKDRVRSMTKRQQGRSLPRIVADLNPVLRGWFGYFKHARGSTFRALDGFIRRRLRAILRAQEKRPAEASLPCFAGHGPKPPPPGFGRCADDQRRWPNAYFATAGLFALDTAWRDARNPR